MAGVYIKGMEMPEHCWQCGLKDSDDFCTAVFAVNNTVATVIGMWGETKRPDWCPLVEVPDHGDLIDRSQLEEDGEWDDRTDGYVGYSRAQVQGAEAVIPADKEEV